MSETPQETLEKYALDKYCRPEIREAIRAVLAEKEQFRAEVVAWTAQAPVVADTIKTLMAERDAGVLAGMRATAEQQGQIVALRRENQEWQDGCLAWQIRADRAETALRDLMASDLDPAEWVRAKQRARTALSLGSWICAALAPPRPEERLSTEDEARAAMGAGQALVKMREIQ